MSVEPNKENIADGLSVLVKTGAPSPSPNKNSKKSRSKSIGPGGLIPLNDESVNRRKSALVPAVKSILAGKEDEAKRREARRKSLAHRRVSFAPEATLHTWDVIEYMRDTTASSSSSGSTRRDSSATQASSATSPSAALNSDPIEPPSPLPEQIEDAPHSNQRDLNEQKRRRRSSGIPPMNFNNPEDLYSSSPVSGSSPINGGDDDSVSGDDDESTAMQLDIDDVTQRSEASSSPTGSSAKLEQALRQAAAQAGTRGIDYDEHGDMSMEIAGDEITSAFKPWIQKSDASGAASGSASQDQENINPFSPAARAYAVAATANQRLDQDENDQDDMSMDITRAIGGIIQNKSSQQEDDDMSMDITKAIGGIISSASLDSSDGDATMDFTMVMGGIKDAAPKPQQQHDTRSALKRRRSSALPMVEESQGSPAKRPATRRQSIRRRRSSMADATLQEATMDMTTALGTIKENVASKPNDHETSVGAVFGDATMDFTIVSGSILKMSTTEKANKPVDAPVNEEDTSMDFTAIVGGAKQTGAPGEAIDQPEIVEIPATPPNPVRSPSKSPVKSAAKSTAKSPAKSLARLPAKAQVSPKKQARNPDSRTQSPKKPQKTLTPTASPRKPLQETLVPGSPEARTPLADITTVVVTPDQSETHAKEAKLDEFTAVKAHATPAITKVQAEATADIVSPAILRSANRRASITPRKFGVPPAISEQPAFKPPTLSDSLKLLSTPRKQVNQSPAKRPKTPTKTPETAKIYLSPRRGPTPRKSPSPKRRAHVVVKSSKAEEASANGSNAGDAAEEQIDLSDFLRLTNMRFMDLTTTKRRPTGFPAAVLRGMDDDDEGDGKPMEQEAPSLESCVVAASCTVPMLEMFQHACHELKKDISDGRTRARELEEDVSAANPPLFREYINAPPAERHIMDSQFRDIKTNARLKSKQLWYGWRGQLLEGVKAGLLRHQADFTADDELLSKQESILDRVLPPLLSTHEGLQAELQVLQERANELASSDQEALKDARDRLVATGNEIAAKKALLVSLQKEVEAQSTDIETLKERKLECTEEIKMAERVREECRGWSLSDVNSLKAKITALEARYGWRIIHAGAQPQTLTFVYRNDLQLFLHPSAFSSGAPNAPISLRYIGADDDVPRPRPLTTSKRFFLQLLRAHIQCIPQGSTPLAGLLSLIGHGWDAALAVAEGVRQLELSYMVDEAIFADDKLSVTAAMLLPCLRTKTLIRFEITAAPDDRDVRVDVDVRVKNVYGERYDEAKMAKSLKERVGDGLQTRLEMGLWAMAVDEMKTKLVRRGRK